MSSIATLNGVQYIIPAYNDTGWAQGTGNLSQYLAAIASATLQPTGGAFTLTAELDFGASYGIKALYHKTETANPSTTGVIRLASADTIGWRNNANGADITLSKDTSDNLKYNATKVLLSGAVVNADINASAAIAYSKLALTGAILNADLAGSIAVNKLVAVTVSRALVSDASGFVSASAVTAATLAFLDATSSVQTQLDAKMPKTGGQFTGSISFDSVSHGITGNTSGSSMAAGLVGEEIRSAVASGSAVNAGTTNQYTDVTSITLSAGIWAISFTVVLSRNSATITTTTNADCGVGTVTGNSSTGILYGDNDIVTTPSGTGDTGFAMSNWVTRISGSTTYYLKAVVAYTAGTPKWYGRISAIRLA